MLNMFKITQIHEEKEEEPKSLKSTSVTTEFFDWSCRHFAQPLMRLSEEQDPESSSHHRREFRFLRNNNVRQEAREEQIRAGKWKVIYCQECEDSLLGSDVKTCAVYTPIKREALCSKVTHTHKHHQVFMWWTEGKYLKDTENFLILIKRANNEFFVCQKQIRVIV